jgi:hypothetical protein
MKLFSHEVLVSAVSGGGERERALLRRRAQLQELRDVAPQPLFKLHMNFNRFLVTFN